MEKQEDTAPSSKGSNGSVEKHGGLNESHTPRKRYNDIVLVPQPTDSTYDPLNLPRWKKEAIFAVVTFAIFSSTVSPLAGQLNLAAQAKLYHKTTTQEAYANSAAIAGLAAGPYLLPFFTLRMGRSSIIFWTLLGLLGTQIWAARMVHHSNYIGYIMSRLIAGIFGSMVGVVGPRILVDIFYLHERGRRFAIIFTVNNFGSVVGPTLSGFISAKTSWPVEFWWTTGLLGLVLFLCFITLEETGFERNTDESALKTWPRPPESWIKNRIATFFFGQALQPRYTASETVQACVSPFLILICPITIVAGLFGLINFGIYVGVNSLGPVFLQRPIKMKGYGFTVLQNAEFSLNHWVGILFVLIYTFFISDVLPLSICRRRGGNWKPEYRLYALALPSFLMPIGCGLWGASFYYHLHYMVAAFASFLVTIGAFAITPILTNYVVECFIDFPVAATMATIFYRIVWGLSIPFYIDRWVEEVHINWAYGTMAFMALASWGLVFVLLAFGPRLRNLSWRSVRGSEDGKQVIDRQ